MLECAGAGGWELGPFSLFSFSLLFRSGELANRLHSPEPSLSGLIQASLLSRARTPLLSCRIPPHHSRPCQVSTHACPRALGAVTAPRGAESLQEGSLSSCGRFQMSERWRDVICTFFPQDLEESGMVHGLGQILKNLKRRECNFRSLVP